ncbi:MAG: RNA polymerase subunit sigma-54 [Planctomycetes bacterium]|nr:RNA polymerase subunit sigma-54 [Planctomycetota bacterium]
MQVPTRVMFDGIGRSEALEALCLRAALKLERFHDHMTSCSVIVTRPHRRHVQGDAWEIRVHVLLPTGEIVTRATATETADRRNLGPALRRAFHAARRRIQDVLRRQRGDIKTHAPRPNRRRRAPKPELELAEPTRAVLRAL